MAQDDTVTFEQNHASFLAFTYVYGWPVLMTYSWGAAFTVSKKSNNTQVYFTKTCKNKQTTNIINWNKQI